MMDVILQSRDSGFWEEATVRDMDDAVEAAHDWVLEGVIDAELIELGETDGRPQGEVVAVWRAQDFEAWRAEEWRSDRPYRPLTEVAVRIPLLYALCGDDEGRYGEEWEDDHDWDTPPFAGGGVWGHGGGLVFVAYCRRCGAERREDTWAEDGCGGRTRSLTVRPLKLLDPDLRSRVEEWLGELEREEREEVA